MVGASIVRPLPGAMRKRILRRAALAQNDRKTGKAFRFSLSLRGPLGPWQSASPLPRWDFATRQRTANGRPCNSNRYWSVLRFSMCPDWITGGLGSFISQSGDFFSSCFMALPPSALVFPRGCMSMHLTFFPVLSIMEIPISRGCCYGTCQRFANYQAVSV